MKNKRTRSSHSPEDLARSSFFSSHPYVHPEEGGRKAIGCCKKKGPKEMGEEERLTPDILQLKFRMEDYVQNKEFKQALTFGSYLKQYVDLLNIERKQFADEISFNETLLRQFFNYTGSHPTIWPSSLKYIQTLHSRDLLV